MDMNHKIEYLKIAFYENGISLSEKQIEKFLHYYNMLIEKNKVMNLTAITEFEEVVTKHFLDSLSVRRVVDLTQKLSVMDMGTGAGFPGIPLAIAFPQLDITLADSLNKRVLFLCDVIEQLELSNVHAVHGRAEELGRSAEYREQYDLVLSRAVANLSTLSEYCIPFVRKGGLFVSYKAADIDDEVKTAECAIDKLGGKIKMKDQFLIVDNQRTLILIQKIRNTPAKYPRKPGTPGKDPLC